MTTTAGDMLSMRQLKERGWTAAMVRDLLGEPDPLRKLILNAPGPGQEASRALTELMETVPGGAR